MSNGAHKNNGTNGEHLLGSTFFAKINFFISSFILFKKLIEVLSKHES